MQTISRRRGGGSYILVHCTLPPGIRNPWESGEIGDGRSVTITTIWRKLLYGRYHAAHQKAPGIPHPVRVTHLFCSIGHAVKRNTTDFCRLDARVMRYLDLGDGTMQCLNAFLGWARRPCKNSISSRCRPLVPALSMLGLISRSPLHFPQSIPPQ